MCGLGDQILKAGEMVSCEISFSNRGIVQRCRHDNWCKDKKKSCACENVDGGGAQTDCAEGGGGAVEK